MSGWIKLHRVFGEWEWYDVSNCVTVFIDLLIHANHEDGKYRGVNIPRGALTTSQVKIAERTGLTVRQVRTVLDKLSSTGELSVKTTNQFSMISINNWEKYQCDERENAHKKSGRCNSDVIPMSTSKNSRIKEYNNTTLRLEDASERQSSTVQKLSDRGSIVNPEWLVVEHFNKVNGKDIKQIDANHKLIKTRLKEGFTVDEMKLVIDFTFKTWTSDPFWHRLNRISTIFNGKFNEYLDQAQNAASREFNPNIEAAREMYKKHFGHYPDEVQNNGTLDQEPA